MYLQIWQPMFDNVPADLAACVWQCTCRFGSLCLTMYLQIWQPMFDNVPADLAAYVWQCTCRFGSLCLTMYLQIWQPMFDNVPADLAAYVWQCTCRSGSLCLTMYLQIWQPMFDNVPADLAAYVWQCTCRFGSLEEFLPFSVAGLSVLAQGWLDLRHKLLPFRLHHSIITIYSYNNCYSELGIKWKNPACRGGQTNMAYFFLLKITYRNTN